MLAYDNGEHNFSFTALTMGIADPFHLSDDQLEKIKAKLIDLKHNVLSFYTTADEALQLYNNNDVALIWANYGQQQVKAMQDAGAHIAYVNPKEGALAWLDTWALTKGVRDKELAEEWVNFVLQQEDRRRALRAHRLRQHRDALRQRRRRRQAGLARGGREPDQARRSLERGQGHALSRRWEIPPQRPDAVGTDPR